MVSVLTQRQASLRASLIVFDPSRAMVRANSSRFSATIAAVLSRISSRSWAACRAQSRRAARRWPPPSRTSLAVAAGRCRPGSRRRDRGRRSSCRGRPTGRRAASSWSCLPHVDGEEIGEHRESRSRGGRRRGRRWSLAQEVGREGDGVGGAADAGQGWLRATSCGATDALDQRRRRSTTRPISL